MVNRLETRSPLLAQLAKNQVRNTLTNGDALPAGYKRTEVGVVPVDWEVVDLGSILSFKNGINASKEQYGSGYSFINVLDIIENISIRHPDIIGKVNVAIKQFEKNKVEYGDILFQRSSETMEEVGQAAVYLDEEKPAAFGGFVILGKKIGEFNPEYLNYQLKNPACRHQITSQSGGSTRYNISQVSLRAAKIPLPPTLPEQRAIATALGDTDALLAALDALIAKQERVKRGVLEELLGGERRLAGFDGEWEEVTFQDVIDGFTSGATPYRKIDKFYTGQINWITSGELNYNEIFTTKEKITVEAAHKTNLSLHPAGTFLIAITGLEAAGTRGSCGIIGTPSTTNQSCMALYPKSDKLDLKYLFYYYSCFGDKFAFEYCQGTKQQSYTAKIVKILPIVLPPLPEQRAIAEVLSALDAELAAVRARRAKVARVKAGMMEALLTGRVRLV